jgi:hypothetical protein
MPRIAALSVVTAMKYEPTAFAILWGIKPHTPTSKEIRNAMNSAFLAVETDRTVSCAISSACPFPAFVWASAIDELP